jgi:hypothetical protein
VISLREFQRCEAKSPPDAAKRLRDSLSCGAQMHAPQHWDGVLPIHEAYKRCLVAQRIPDAVYIVGFALKLEGWVLCTFTAT